jgi:hypothetical protein
MAGGWEGGQLALLYLSKKSFEKLLSAERVEVQIAIPTGAIEGYFYFLRGIGNVATPLRKACPAEKLRDISPILIEPSQISSYLSGDLAIDVETRKLVEAKKDK